MQSGTQLAAVSKKWLWAGRVVSAMSVLFMVFDGVIHVMNPAFVVQAFAGSDIPIALLAVSEDFSCAMTGCAHSFPLRS